MTAISSFAALTAHLKDVCCRKRLAVANAVDEHTLAAVMRALDAGIIEAYLIGDVAAIESPHLFESGHSAHIHIIDCPDVQSATLEAVRMVREGEADILMKGLVNTDVILRAILDKERGLLPLGETLTYNAALEIPRYHKPAVLQRPRRHPLAHAGATKGHHPLRHRHGAQVRHRAAQGGPHPRYRKG